MKDQFIGLMIEAKPSLVVGLQAILKSKNTFVPINPVFPSERIHFIINDCNINVVLTDNIHYPRMLQIAQNNPNIRHILCIDSIAGELIVKHSVENRNITIKFDAKTIVQVQELPTSFCYVIYTSGSTGRPKGVPINHSNLIPLFIYSGAYLNLGIHTRVMQNLSYTFDFGVFEILSTLLSGGQLFVPNKSNISDFSYFSHFIDCRQINTLHTTPLFLNSLAETGQKMFSLKFIHLGGEQLPSEVVKKVLNVTSPWCCIHNGYGPTEASVNCTFFSMTKETIETIDANANYRIPIGRPSDLHNIYILDKHFNLQPIGVVGELFISGPGLAQGYINCPELTCEKFKIKIKNENEKLKSKNGSGALRANFHHSKLYKTGDLARWLLDGNIEFLGRIDHQVKIRGFRIELGEIESCLSLYAGIKETVVIARQHENGTNYLCAYILTHRGEALMVSQLREYLATKLPDYMIPAYFIQLESIPMTLSGKIDMKALPGPGEALMDTDIAYVAPVSETEVKLASIWQNLLRLERIGINNDFFQLGGDSILVNRCIASIREEFHVEIPLRKFFEKPYIKTIAEEIEKQEGQDSSIKPVERIGEIPLSFAQERLWFLQELDADNVAYFVPRVIRMKGKLDVSLIERTFTEIIRRHEILRTVFPTIDGQPVQRIQPPYEFKIPLLDWSRLIKEVQEQRVSRFLSEEDRRIFDFEKGPLLRVTIIKLKKEEHLFVLTEHHLVHDGWTQGVLLREFIAIFRAYTEGKKHGLLELPIQYADFAIWQRNYLKGDALERHLAYWQEKLAGLAPVLELPADRPRPPVISGRGELEIVRLSGSYTDHLKKFSRTNGVTFFMTMLTAFKILLYRYTGVEDLCVGTGVANRKYKEMEGMLGMVINTLSLRTQVEGEISFNECLNRVRETCLEAYRHGDTPFGKVVEVLKPERNLSYTPIFQVLFSFMDTPGEQLRLPGLELELLPAHNRSAKFDINVVVAPPLEHEENENAETLVEWEYNTDIFDPPSIQRMVSHYNRLLEEGINRPETNLSFMSMLSEVELKKVLYEFNDTQNAYPSDKTIHELFEEQASKTSDRIAIVGAEREEKKRRREEEKDSCVETLRATSLQQITYRQLNEQSNYLAGLLIEKGVLTDDIVAIKIERSIEMVIGTLGILKAGGAYMPIDPSYPQERIDYMMKDSGAKLVIGRAEERKSGRAEKEEIVFISFFPASSLRRFLASDSSSLAYIMYTSGSTGKPKGVLVTHRNVVRLVKNTNFVPLTEETRILQTGAPVFDAATFEIWGSLLNGGTLILVDKEVILDAFQLGSILKKNCMNTLWISAPLFNQLLEQNSNLFAPLNYLLVGGDRLSPEHINRLRRLFPGLKIINGYGPTENTTFSVCHRMDRDYEHNIPIGKPIANSTAYIMDKYNCLQPIGVPGELYVGGDGLARGYLNNPELTCEKFNQDLWDYLDNQDEKNKSFFGGDRGAIFSKKAPLVYRTGDLARWLNDGTIEFLGRVDNQVKIRGFRVELGEIENRLAKHGEIREVIVRVLSNDEEIGNKFLCAYFIAQRKLDTDELREYLEREFPSYMIPAYFVQLEKMPLTLNGKLDRGALPMPQLKKGKKFVAPVDEIEVQMVEIWSNVLGIKKEVIGIQDDFFHLGGHSLKATRLTGQIAKMFNVKFSLTDVFTGPTIREMSAVIQQGRESFYEEIRPVEKREYYPQSSAQKRLFFLEQFENIGTTYNISSILKIEGKLDFQRFHQAIKKIIQRHEILRTSFKIIDNDPVQIVHEPVDFEMENYTGSPGSPVEERIRAFIRPFDLSRAPLFRVGLISLPGESCLLLCDLHHIAGDGISMEILIDDLAAFYDGNDLQPLNVQYKDFTSWQNDVSKSPEIEKQEKYWLSVFAKEIPKLNFPTDYPRPENLSFKGDRYLFTLEGEDANALHSLAAENRATLFMVLLAAFNALLYKYCGQSDIIVGTGIMGRPHAYLHRTIGMFVNSLAIRNYPSGEKTFRQFLSEVRENCIRAFANQDVQFEELVGKLKLPRDNSRNPLFDVLLVVQNFEQTKFNDLRESVLKDVTILPYRHENKTSKFDLNLAAWEVGNDIHFRMEYAAALFKQKTIVEITNNYTWILKQVIKKRDILLSELTISNVLMEAKPNISQMDKTDFTF